MDGSIVEHSDSDSGESWTLLEPTPAYGDVAPDVPENRKHERDTVEINEKDDDTDGISIITDSDPETSSPCEISERWIEGENRPTEQQFPYILTHAPGIPSVNNHDHHESNTGEHDFVGDNSCKLKTYVHRRNKRLSTVLNIIVLGSVITAAGVAIGHMWGVRDDCTYYSSQSVNKILSNLYKLQEENTYLRNKLKELTLATNIQFQQRKLEPKSTLKQQRCKKVFEQSLNNQNADKLTKCVDHDGGNTDKVLDSHMTESKYEKGYTSDINKLKNIYRQNKSWVDDDVNKRTMKEKQAIKEIKNNMKPIKLNEEQELLKDGNLDVQIYMTQAVPDIVLDVVDDKNIKNILTDNKITYADSPKPEKSEYTGKKKYKRALNEIIEQVHRKTPKNDNDVTGISREEELKDHRHIGYKYKPEKKKHDRQKLHKKQKRKNKYDQWETKDIYAKDYDGFSITSSQKNEFILKNPGRKYLNTDFERNNCIHQLSETDDKLTQIQNIKGEMNLKHKKDNVKTDKEMSWYEKRAAFRTEARKRIEQEFGGASPNSAGWYFRRMQRREQCRAEGDNSTFKKHAKRNILNFKTKH